MIKNLAERVSHTIEPCSEISNLLKDREGVPENLRLRIVVVSEINNMFDWKHSYIDLVFVRPDDFHPMHIRGYTMAGLICDQEIDQKMMEAFMRASVSLRINNFPVFLNSTNTNNQEMAKQNNILSTIEEPKQYLDFAHRYCTWRLQGQEDQARVS